MSHIRHIENNIVLVGANGSGKSTFVMALSEVMASNISFAVLASQHCLSFDELINESDEDPINKLYNFQKYPINDQDYFVNSMVTIVFCKCFLKKIADLFGENCISILEKVAESV